MAKVTGIGGVFVRARDPKALRAWYREHLGIDVEEWGAYFVPPADQPGQGTVWNPLPADTKYFDPSDKPFMINFRVDDLDALLAKLHAAGAQVLDRRGDESYGKFGYVVDPEGTLLELWEETAGESSAS